MIYFNNAATSYPKAPGVGAAMADCVSRLPGAANRGNYKGQSKAMECRSELARLFGASSTEQIVLTKNATEGLNIALLGMGLKEKDVVLTTAAEHNSVLRPLYFLGKQAGVRRIVVPVDEDGRVNPSVWKEYCDRYHPAGCVFTYASNVTGAVNPVDILSEISHKAGAWVCVDASQAAGLFPIDGLGEAADLAVITGHKYLLGPQGTGALYVREGLCLTPVYTGGTGIHSDEEEMPSRMPLRLEAGTENEPSLAGLLAALRWQRENPVPIETLMEWMEIMTETLKKQGYHVIDVKGLRTPVISFWSDWYEAGDLGDILTESFDILCRSGLHCAPLILPYVKAPAAGTVRLSLSRFTTREEVEECMEALRIIHSEEEFYE